MSLYSCLTCSIVISIVVYSFSTVLYKTGMTCWPGAAICNASARPCNAASCRLVSLFSLLVNNDPKFSIQNSSSLGTGKHCASCSSDDRTSFLHEIWTWEINHTIMVLDMCVYRHVCVRSWISIVITYFIKNGMSNIKQLSQMYKTIYEQYLTFTSNQITLPKNTWNIWHWLKVKV